MSDRLEAAIRELVDALRAELAQATPPAVPPPDELLSIPAAAKVLSIGRSKVYDLIDRDELHTLTVGRRRLVSRSAIADFVAAQAAERERERRQVKPWERNGVRVGGR